MVTMNDLYVSVTVTVGFPATLFFAEVGVRKAKKILRERVLNRRIVIGPPCLAKVEKDRREA